MAKIPGGKPPEKIEPLLQDGLGVVNGPADAEPVGGPTFAADHQLPVQDEPGVQPPVQGSRSRGMRPGGGFVRSLRGI